jgi:hypothetical protein
MSGTPIKRLHEEGGGGHSSSSTPKHPLDDSSALPKLTSSSSLSSPAKNATPLDTPTPFQDAARTPKIPRSESRDAERRPVMPLLPPPSYRISLNDSHPEPPPASENKSDLRDHKDSSSTRDFKAETKTEPKEWFQDAKVVVGCGSDKDARPDISKGDDANKEIKHERGDVYTAEQNKVEPKDGYSGGGNNQFNYKEPNKGKRYPPDNAPPGGNADTWHSSSRIHTITPTATATATNAAMATTMASTNLHVDVGKEVASASAAHMKETEAVGDNKVDIKEIEKERKRKDGKWIAEREKERSSSHHRDSPQRKEEKESSERKDIVMKDKLKDREKDSKSTVEKDALEPEKDNNNNHNNVSNNNDITMEEIDNDSIKERKKERDGTNSSGDVGVEGERPEKRSKLYEKESDDGDAGAEGGTERERGIFNYGVQQRKRMLRPRGSPQLGVRDARFRSRTTQDNNEGSQGKQDVSTVVYRVGECMQELIKSWKEYESQADKTAESSQNGPTLEIHIPAEHVTATNRQVRGGQLWGTDIYTDDSDLVAVLMHTGYCRPTASPPPPAIQELRATIKVLPPQDCYVSTLRNNVRSRAWGAAIGCSYVVERCCIVKKGGGTIDLEPCLTHTSAVEPTLAPVVVERTMTTRAAASNALRQQRFVREVTIQYNLCNEPWIKYSISAVADKGLKKPLYTSARLKKGEVLYLESHSCRYELCFSGEKVAKATIAAVAHATEAEASQRHQTMNGSSNTTITTTMNNNTANNTSSNGEKVTTAVIEGGENGGVTMIDVFRWSRCKKPLPQKVMLSFGIPLIVDHLEVLEENVEWEDIQWSQAGVWIAGKEYPLVRVHFLSPT